MSSSNIFENLQQKFYFLIFEIYFLSFFHVSAIENLWNSANFFKFLVNDYTIATCWWTEFQYIFYRPIVFLWQWPIVLVHNVVSLSGLLFFLTYWRRISALQWRVYKLYTVYNQLIKILLSLVCFVFIKL